MAMETPNVSRKSMFSARVLDDICSRMFTMNLYPTRGMYAA